MQEDSPQSVILERYAQVAPFIEDAIAAANGERNALGFLPAQIFGEHAQKGNLFIAAIVDAQGRLQYAGHLLFDARTSRARVLQIYARPEHRRHGIAQRLLGQLKQHATDLGFISIYASVAEDLKAANDFWHRNEFYVQRTKPGGKTRNRTILVRCHELSSPQLFERSGISAQNPFGLDTSQGDDKPIYLLDLNVLFDLGPRRARHEAALDLFHAERHGACQLALSAELHAELARQTAVAARTDPMQAWAATFVTFPLPPAQEKARLLETLGTVVFPERTKAGAITPNDASDMTHLATAIHHRLAGFITSDAAILAVSAELSAMFDIEVISPEAFQRADELGSREELFETATAGESLSVAGVESTDESEVRSLLNTLGVSDADAVSIWGAVGSSERSVDRSAVHCRDRLVGYLACLRKSDASTVNARLAVDESHPESRGAARLLLNRLLAKASASAPAKVRIHLAQRQVVVREIASVLGFAGSDDGTVLSKLILNRIVTSKNWTSTVSELQSLARLKLPSACPSFKDIDQQVEVLCPDGNRRFVRLNEVETSLAPALFCLPGRRAVITPIQPDFAEHLLQHSPQDSLLPLARAAQYSERHYISDKKTLKQFTRGTLILFYESSKGGGSSSIVAIARVQRAYLKPGDAIDRSDLNPSVLTVEALSEIGQSALRTVTAFDNLIVFPRPVPLSSLQRMGCGAAHQLITTRAIDAEQLEKILAEGFST